MNANSTQLCCGFNLTSPHDLVCVVFSCISALSQHRSMKNNMFLSSHTAVPPLQGDNISSLSHVSGQCAGLSDDKTTAVICCHTDGGMRAQTGNRLMVQIIVHCASTFSLHTAAVWWLKTY